MLGGSSVKISNLVEICMVFLLLHLLGSYCMTAGQLSREG